jgi:hypothetical protein
MGGQLLGSRPKWIVLPSDLVRRCRQYGYEAVAKYARGEQENSHAYSYRGADKDPEVWQLSKMGECVFAIEHALDPLAAVNWICRPDKHDVQLDNVRVEIKSSHPRAKYLFWSIVKNGLFAAAEFDVIVLTRVSLKYEVGYSAGWVTKQEFADQHLVAGPDHKLDEGTWYMEQPSLHEMQTLARR